MIAELGDFHYGLNNGGDQAFWIMDLSSNKCACRAQSGWRGFKVEWLRCFLWSRFGLVISIEMYINTMERKDFAHM